jgi:hypothetical protein
MSDAPRSLAKLQRWMQAVITHPDGAAAGVESDVARQQVAITAKDVEQVVTRSRALRALDRLQIYAGAYYARLLECLREEFAVLARAVGAEAFDGFAFGYLQHYPSRSYTLNRLGENFARYLAETRPAGEDRWADLVIDLATLEWTIGQVFDGAGDEGQPLLDPDQLAALPAGRIGSAVIEPTCSLRLVSSRFPLKSYYRSLRAGEDPPLPEPAVSYLAVFRREFTIRLLELSEVQYRLVEALARGEPLDSAIGSAVPSGDHEPRILASDLGSWFQDWTAAGLFRAVVA